MPRLKKAGLKLKEACVVGWSRDLLLRPGSPPRRSNKPCPLKIQAQPTLRHALPTLFMQEQQKPASPPALCFRFVRTSFVRFPVRDILDKTPFRTHGSTPRRVTFDEHCLEQWLGKASKTRFVSDTCVSGRMSEIPWHCVECVTKSWFAEHCRSDTDTNGEDPRQAVGTGIRPIGRLVHKLHSRSPSMAKPAPACLCVSQPRRNLVATFRITTLAIHSPRLHTASRAADSRRKTSMAKAC
ncbi:uncharacterized protein SPSC_03514 [Sporisorium scitamineum]|uniref:Uncharacterized protein n=1 Tax=Sporisorium scitamineum TaxID=49012 RepID=A0A140KN23_9BASI|nr:uncharacterized protein SPSC_03514 [Sporisorium scitamineum]